MAITQLDSHKFGTDDLKPLSKNEFALEFYRIDPTLKSRTIVSEILAHTTHYGATHIFETDPRNGPVLFIYFDA